MSEPTRSQIFGLIEEALDKLSSLDSRLDSIETQVSNMSTI